MATIPGYKTIKDLQDQTGLCRTTIEKLVKTGKFPSRRFGRLILVPDSALADYLASLPPAFPA